VSSTRLVKPVPEFGDDFPLVVLPSSLPAFAAAVFWAIALVGIGLLLLVDWRTRGIGAGLVAAGLLSCVTFYGGIAVLLRLDRAAWRHEPPPSAIGPDQTASLVIYFRHGTTEEQIKEFRSSVLTGTAEPSEYLRYRTTFCEIPFPHTFPALATARKILPSVTLAARVH
jgi:hypothetical protein